MASGPSKPNWVSESQMQEALAFNASLTRADARSRGRPRGSGINRVGGSSFAPTRPTSHYAAPVVRAGSGTRTGPGTNWTIGFTTAQPVFKPTTPRARSRSPTRSVSTPTMIGPYTVGPLPSTAPTKPPSPPKIRESALVANGTLPVEQDAAMPQATQFQHQYQHRERIVSNMAADDPSKPWIPAHLQQTSAFEAIRRLSEMSGLSLEELTSDGVSIPALPRDRAALANVPASIPASIPTPVPAVATNPTQANAQTTQGDVDPNAWMSAYLNKGSANSGHYQVSQAQAPIEATHAPRVASYSEMDVDMTDESANTPSAHAVAAQSQQTWQVGTLVNSQWAASPNDFRPALPASQTSGGGMQATSTMSGQGWNAHSMENVKPTMPHASDNLSTTTANFSDILARALAESKPEKKLATLKDSRWA
ncbi:hypothetical protein EG329_011621 [Mollisiaceae sp. DMI_Dod_QoI]|nr:hypothetical protein EG329_011621 [Helotiales sp. DMI_Dod_QoI]